MKTKILLLLCLLIVILGGIGASILRAEDANMPTDPNAIVDPNEINDPNVIVPE